ncbi:hypothetical protein MRX96_019256 [Rhipicephalus microplus]
MCATCRGQEEDEMSGTRMLFRTGAAETMCPLCLCATVSKLVRCCDVSKAVTTRNTSERCLLGPTHASSGCVLKAVHVNTLSAHLCPISVANHPLSYRRVPANEARPRMLMIVGLDHTFHYSSGVKNTLLLQTIFLHELTTIARVRDASRPGCLPFNENMLSTIRLLAYPFLLYLVSAATHTLWPICHPFNENMLSAIGLLAHTSLLYLVNAPIHHLCEPKVQASEDRQRLRLSTGLSHMRQYSSGEYPIPPTAPGQLLYVQALM